MNEISISINRTYRFSGALCPFEGLTRLSHRLCRWSFNFAFGILGTRDWVDEGSEEASYKVPGMKLIPQGVAMIPAKADLTLEQLPNYEKRKLSGAGQAVQLMVIADDAANKLQVKAYRNWQEPPFYETAWVFPHFK